jgi:uncharacterized MnhB-related membrane protein
MWLVVLIVVGILICAVQAIRAHHLLISALWLAGTSALVALLIYRLGAPEVAVIELSVGAGLVTVLFVFAINIAGDEPISTRNIIPRPLAWGLIGAAFLLLGWFAFSWAEVHFFTSPATPVVKEIWQKRGLDLILQVVLIFCGVLGVLGLLTEGRTPPASHPEVKQ